jgi:hypothetical protein
VVGLLDDRFARRQRVRVHAHDVGDLLARHEVEHAVAADREEHITFGDGVGHGLGGGVHTELLSERIAERTGERHAGVGLLLLLLGGGGSRRRLRATADATDTFVTDTVFALAATAMAATVTG